MAERSKNVWSPLLPTKFAWNKLKKTFSVAVSHLERLESPAKCLNRGNLTLRVRKRCFWVISTPSSGRKWQKRIFFGFFLIEIHQNIFEPGCGNKKFLGMISKHFMFSYHRFFSLKVFHDGPRGSKHAKFKSKKQNITNFKFLKFEAIIDPNKYLHKRKKIQPKMNEIWQLEDF